VSNLERNAPHPVSCHCGAIRLEVKADLVDVVECNCSTCGRHGFLHWKVDSAAVLLVSQRCTLSLYKWREAIGGHEFCTACGVALLRSGYPDGRVSVNARCIEGIDVFELPVRRFNGRCEMPPGPQRRGCS
jgi:hypothetical protein